MNTIQKFEEELNNDLNNQMQLNSNEDIEKINESFPSYY